MRRVMMWAAGIAALAAWPVAALDVASRSTVFEGSYAAEVVRVIDGDTIAVRAGVWPGMAAETSVRVRGIDAPELRGAKCDAERSWAERAAATVARLYPEGAAIRLDNVEFGAFAGRVIADVRRPDRTGWAQLSDDLIARDLAVAWTPRDDKPDWCAMAEARE